MSERWWDKYEQEATTASQNLPTPGDERVVSCPKCGWSGGVGRLIHHSEIEHPVCPGCLGHLFQDATSGDLGPENDDNSPDLADSEEQVDE